MAAFFRDGNHRRRDHPISPSTLTNMAAKPRTSCQHALFMLRWLDRPPESFLAGMAGGDDPRFALPWLALTGGFAGASNCCGRSWTRNAARKA